MKGRVFFEKLEIIKLSEEGPSKAGMGRKLGLLCQKLGLLCLAGGKSKVKVLEGSEKCCSSKQMVRKQNCLVADREKLSGWIDETSHNLPLRQTLI